MNKNKHSNLTVTLWTGNSHHMNSSPVSEVREKKDWYYSSVQKNAELYVKDSFANGNSI